jgi:hypothetical protein
MSYFVGANPEFDDLHRDAMRWRYARQFLAVEDVERWPEEMRGHQPDEAESLKADAAIDKLRDCVDSESTSS